MPEWNFTASKLFCNANKLIEAYQTVLQPLIEAVTDSFDETRRRLQALTGRLQGSATFAESTLRPGDVGALQTARRAPLIRILSSLPSSFPANSLRMVTS